MKKWSLGKKLMLPLFVLLPILAYGIFELNSLTGDERALEQIYQRQLDAVLFSIDQYIDDKMRKWAGELDVSFNEVSDEDVLSSLSNNTVFRALYVYDPGKNNSKILSNAPPYKTTAFSNTADSVFSKSEVLFRRLTRYKESDFQKLEVMEQTVRVEGNEAGILPFVVGTGDSIKTCLYFFDVQDFFEDVLAPKFQEISRNDFVLVGRRVGEENPMYSTQEVINTELVSQELAPLPQYEIGIARAGGTVQEVVKQRKQQNLVSLGLLILFLLFGLGLVFRNIRREVELAQNKADFVSNVSHEIRTPLALINMFAETLLMGRVRTEEKKQEYYGIITKEVSRLSNMVNRILSFSKMEANKREYNKQQLSANQLTEEVVNTYSYHLESNGFSYAFEPSPDLPLIQADREALIEVIVNLIDNAMKYSLDKKHVSVNTGMESAMVCIEIKDQGMGIPKDQLDRLFEKFYRVNKGDLHETKGAGLGLTIVKQIVDAHGGKIIVESTLGKGSAFKLLFPPMNNQNG